ncbi:Hypothetical predicted protein [Paramuricea clavata]|uniref:Endonuclease/exonuclease/phosphatase domain-containing protein n=1 Tax=Paramuricea clavata TaxID=317549 RepID=A0A7D9I4N9_PARCT|nr:Hypothetical predicted protein [Paramuricea clavata]
MAASCCANKLILILILALFITYFIAHNSTHNVVNDVSSLLVGCKLDIRFYLGRNSGLPRLGKTLCAIPTSSKIMACVHLVKFSLAAGYLVLLSNDVNLNPGPTAGALICPWCDKSIQRNQAHSQCTSCELDFHLKCLGAEYNQTGCCHLCSSLLHNLAQPEYSSDELFLPAKLRKIDEVRIIVNELRWGLHLIALTETWLNKEIPDAELQIPGYNLFRRDRGVHGGGIGVYVKRNILVTRREDLGNVDVEGLWLEISLPKSRGFLVGTFYPNSSNHHDKDFMFKLNNSLDIASAQGKEVLITGDLNVDLLAKRAVIPECKQLRSLLKCLQFKQVIDKPTRIAPNSLTLLDIIATNRPQNISDSGVITTNLSDHEMTFCVQKIN